MIPHTKKKYIQLIQGTKICQLRKIPFEMSELVEYSLYGHFFFFGLVEGPRCVCLSPGG